MTDFSPSIASIEPAFRVVLTHPHQYIVRRIWRRLTSVVGALLLLVGLTASIVAVPANLAVVGLALGWMTSERTPADPWPPPDVPIREIVLAWAIATPIALAGTRGGLRLLRRHRTMVLFLRRFGYDDAQSAVTFAVLRTIGSSWRIVTLDDAEMAPIGVATAPRRLFDVGGQVTKQVLVVGHFLGLRMFPVLTSAMWGVLAVALLPPAVRFAATGSTTWRAWEPTVDPFVRIIASVFEGRPPLDAVTLSLPGLFAILAMAAAVSFGMLILSMIVLLAALPAGAVLFFLSGSADSVHEAETSKAITVTSPAEIDRAANAIAGRSHKVFGPRLVVVRVASPAWQHAVSKLASLSSRLLIDISEPTENVLWEVQELTARFGDRCVLIGHYDRVSALATSHVNPHAPAVEKHLAELLKGRAVLAYTSDRHGQRRFAKALRGLLLTED